MTYCFAERSTLANRDYVTLLHTEAWRHVRSQVLVPFLIPRVFGDKVEVFAADDEGAVHFCGDHGAGEDATADGDHASERAFLI